MARKLPGPIRKRDILFAERSTPQELSEYGHLFLKGELYWDAVEFFGGAKDEEGLKQVKEAGIEVADAYLLRRVARQMPKLVKPEDWLRLGEQAFGQEKYRDALEGFMRGGNEARKAEAEEKLAELGPEDDRGAKKAPEEGEAPSEEEEEE